MNLKSISFEIKHQLKAKHTLLLFSKLHLFSSDKSITQAVVKAFVLVKGPLSPLDVSVGSFFRQISPRSSKFQLWTVKWLQPLSVWHLFYSLRYYLAMCLFGELSQVLTVNPNYTDSKAVSLSRETNPSNQDVDTTREVGFDSIHLSLVSNTWSCCWMNLWKKTAAFHSSCYPVSRCLGKCVSSCWTLSCISWPPLQWGRRARPHSAPCRWQMKPPWRWWRRSFQLAWRWNSPPCWGKATARTSPAGASGSRRRQSRAHT